MHVKIISYEIAKVQNFCCSFVKVFNPLFFLYIYLTRRMLIVPNSVSLRLMTLMLVASNAQISLATSAKNRKKIKKIRFYGLIFLMELGEKGWICTKNMSKIVGFLAICILSSGFPYISLTSVVKLKVAVDFYP